MGKTIEYPAEFKLKAVRTYLEGNHGRELYPKNVGAILIARSPKKLLKLLEAGQYQPYFYAPQKTKQKFAKTLDKEKIKV